MKKYLFRALLCLGIIVSGCKKDEIPSNDNDSDQNHSTAISVIQSGKSGENATYTLYSNGLMKIEGTGAMYDAENENPLPWNPIKKDVTKVEIADGITSIGVGAFAGCSGLTSVTIPESVTSIGEMAFYYCSKLSSIIIPASVTSIGGHAFWACSDLKSAIIPGSVTSIGFNAFKGCYFSKNNISNSSSFDITSERYGAKICETEQKDGLMIDGNVAVHCRSWATSVTIPNTVTVIGDHAFEGCSNLTSMAIPNTITSIGGAAFQNCSNLASVTFWNTVTRIEWYAFSGCTALTHVALPSSISEIEAYLFYECSGLTSVTIPHTVKKIGLEAFYLCKSLTTVTCKAVTPPSVDYAVFTKVPMETLYVPEESIQAYMNAEGWKDFKEIKPIRQ